MSDHIDQINLPPRLNRDDGNSRRVGFELEFSGITLHEAGEAVRSAMEGRLASESSAERVIDTDAWGEFIIEIDWDYLKRKAKESKQEGDAEEWLEHLSRAAGLLVPVEVVCPPIPLTDLSVLEPMVGALRDAGAIGTEESLIAAYGVHINAEIPRLDADTLFSYLRAFAVLQWWMIDTHDIDGARKVSPYIAPYPEAYLLQILSRQSATMDEIFTDYLEHNATRNRALDLLPMLAEIDEERVMNTVDDPRIKARPAFHYRLPNCHIERPDWSLAGAWNVWCVLEQLSDRPDDMDVLADEFLTSDRFIIGVNRNKWVRYIDEWLKDRELV